MGPKMKMRVHNAVRHGGIWFTSAGLSLGVCVWMLIDLAKSFSQQ